MKIYKNKNVNNLQKYKICDIIDIQGFYYIIFYTHEKINQSI